MKLDCFEQVVVVVVRFYVVKVLVPQFLVVLTIDIRDIVLPTQGFLRIILENNGAYLKNRVAELMGNIPAHILYRFAHD
jgi:hypothetical protein